MEHTLRQLLAMLKGMENGDTLKRDGIFIVNKGCPGNGYEHGGCCATYLPLEDVVEALESLVGG